MTSWTSTIHQVDGPSLMHHWALPTETLPNVLQVVCFGHFLVIPRSDSAAGEGKTSRAWCNHFSGHGECPWLVCRCAPGWHFSTPLKSMSHVVNSLYRLVKLLIRQGNEPSSKGKKPAKPQGGQNCTLHHWHSQPVPTPRNCRHISGKTRWSFGMSRLAKLVENSFSRSRLDAANGGSKLSIKWVFKTLSPKTWCSKMKDVSF